MLCASPFLSGGALDFSLGLLPNPLALEAASLSAGARRRSKARRTLGAPRTTGSGHLRSACDLLACIVSNGRCAISGSALLAVLRLLSGWLGLQESMRSVLGC
jgi:hypothetical protein